MIKSVFLATLVTLAAWTPKAEGSLPSVRIVQRIDAGWKFALDPTATDFENPGFDDSAWRPVNLPHDWSIEAGYLRTNQAVNSWLPGGVGVYRKSFDVPKEWLDRQIRVHFDAVYMNSTIWLNGHRVGGRPYGFISFSCDLSPFIKEGRNSLVLLADDTPVPTARFYHGGGIYGHVDLQVLPETRIVPDGGIYVISRNLSKTQAELRITTEVEALSPETLAGHQLRHRLFDPMNRLVAETQTEAMQIKPSGMTVTTIGLKVPNPKPWSPESPTLYHLESELIQGGRVEDVVRTTVGIRSTKFSPETGFWLNGVNRKLQGVCEHFVACPVGRAMPDELIEWRLKLLRKMGCNAIRTAHYPYPPTFYDLCDKIGIMVMNEAFDGWHKKSANDYGGRFFKEWWERDTRDFIRRDRNHPSVIMWSVGNETGNTDKIGVTRLINQLDPSRPTTGGTVFFSVDVSGFNAPGETPGVLEKFHNDHPEKPVVLTEAPHTLQTRGFYRVLTWWRDKGGKRFDIEPYGDEEIFFDGHPLYSSSYDNCGVRCSARTAWKRDVSFPWVCGEFRWTGFDCIGEGGFMGAIWPKRIYNCGIIDLAGIPKDHYYFYQSRWTKEPMIHLLPHWTHPELKPGTVVPVVAYSNCKEAELFLNGKSLGRKTISDMFEFVWKVPYAPGELKVVGYRDGNAVSEKIFRTAGSPVQIKLENEAGGDLSIVTVSAVDAAGNLVPWTRNRIDFAVSGPVTVLGYENGDPVDVTHNKASYRNLFYGMARGFYQSTGVSGSGELVAAGILGEKRFRRETSVTLVTSRLALGGSLRPADLTIRYTLDGSEPTGTSPIYKAPITLRDTTLVRAAIFEGALLRLRTEDLFEKGEPVRILPDDRFLQPKKANAASREAFQGPFDSELVGDWLEGGVPVFRFAKDGNLFEFESGRPVHVGWWWYDFPDDTQEDPKAVGAGEVRWKANGKVLPLKLKSQKAEQLILTQGNRVRTFIKNASPASP